MSLRISSSNSSWLTPAAVTWTHCRDEAAAQFSLNAGENECHWYSTSAPSMASARPSALVSRTSASSSTSARRGGSASR